MASWNKPPQKDDSAVDLLFENEPLVAIEEATIDQAKTQAVRDIFGPGANPNRRYVAEYEKAAQYSSSLKGLGLNVVYTPGVWDLPHIGHCRYLEEAKQHGDILIVGTELDEAISIRKGPNRPVVPFNERVEMLCHIRHVDLVVPIPDFDTRGFSGLKMVEAIQPNTFVVSKRSFREADDTHEWLERARAFCEEIQILESMAETSTSAKIRGLLMDMGEHTKNALNEAEALTLTTVTKAFEEVKRHIDEVARKA